LNKYRGQIIILLVLMGMLTLSGCALLQIPFTMAGGALKLVGKVLQVVDQLPKPPPGVFGPF